MEVQGCTEVEQRRSSCRDVKERSLANRHTFVPEGFTNLKTIHGDLHTFIHEGKKKHPIWVL